MTAVRTAQPLSDLEVSAAGGRHLQVVTASALAEVTDAQREAATERRAALRAGLRQLAELEAGIAATVREAYTARDDIALAYPTWNAYCEDVLGDIRALRIPTMLRAAIVAELSAIGMSTRELGSALHLGNKTVREDLLRAAGHDPRGGSLRTKAAAAAPAPTPQDDVVDAELVEDDDAPPARTLTKPAQVEADLDAAGPAGLTSLELGRLHPDWSCPWAILSEMHAQTRRGVRRIERLAHVERDGYAPYILGHHVGDQVVSAPGRRSRRRLPSA